MAIHPVPLKQLDPKVMEEGEDAALLGSGAAPSGDLVTSDGAGGTTFSPPGTPGAHKSTHSDGQSDEITVQDLGSGAAASGDVLAADGAGALSFVSPSAPGLHATTHEENQTDELTVQNLGSTGASSGEVLTADGAGGLSFTSPTSGMFVKTVGGASPDFADISAALSSLETGAAKKGILLIGATSTPWGTTVVTLTKPVTFIGTVEGAGFTIGSAGLLTVDLAGLDEGVMEFENVSVSKSGGDNGIDFAQSTVLKFRKCSVSNSSGEAAGLFRTLVTATNGNITVFGEDTDFDGDTPGGSVSEMFVINDANGNFEAHLKNCTWFNTAGNGATFVRTSGGNVDLFLSDGCVLHRAGIATGSGNLDIHYKDGSSLVTDFVSGGIGLANVIGGTTSIHGEETYTTDMDSFSAEIDIQRVLLEHMGLTINIGPGTFAYSVALLPVKPDVTIRGAGQDSTILSFSGSDTAIRFLPAALRNTIQDLKIKLTVTGTGFGIAADSTTDEMKVRNITIELDVDKGGGISVSGPRSIVENVRVKSTTTTANAIFDSILVNGDDSVIRGCFVDHTGVLTGNQTRAGIFSSSGKRIIIENNRVTGNIDIGIRADGENVQIIGNQIDQVDLDSADKAGTIAISFSGRNGLVSHNHMQNIGEFGVKITGSAERTTVISNYIKGGQSGSIGIEAEVANAANIIIKDNTIENGTIGQASIGTGIKLFATGVSGATRTVVQGNAILRVLIVGIDVAYSTITAGDIQGPSISDNDIIFNNQTALIGIRVIGTSLGTKIISAIIDQNRIYMGTSTNPGNGIIVHFASDFSISHNHLEGRASTGSSNGIEVKDSIDGKVASNRVLGFDDGIESISAASGESDENQYAINHLRGNVTNAVNFAANETNRDEVFNKV